jgi:hypothetical protein
MNTETDLESWERFLRAYVDKHGLKYEDVLQDPLHVERLNLIWLRTRNRSKGNEESCGTE